MVHFLVKVSLIKPREDADKEGRAANLGVMRNGAGWCPESADRKRAKRLVVLVQRQCDLFEIVLALRPPSRLARVLHSRQQERNENRNNGDHDKQFDERESTSLQLLGRFHSMPLGIAEFRQASFRLPDRTVNEVQSTE